MTQSLLDRLQHISKNMEVEDPDFDVISGPAVANAERFVRALFERKPDTALPMIFADTGLISIEWRNATVTITRKLLVLDFDDKQERAPIADMDAFVGRVCAETLTER